MPFKAIEVKHFANRGKALLPHVKKTARKIANYLLHLCSRREFLHGKSKKAVWAHIKGKELIKDYWIRVSTVYVHEYWDECSFCNGQRRPYGKGVL